MRWSAWLLLGMLAIGAMVLLLCRDEDLRGPRGRETEVARPDEAHGPRLVGAPAMPERDDSRPAATATLEPGDLRLRGRVLAADGRPVAGAHVDAALEEGAARLPLARYTSSATGSYELDLRFLADLTQPRRASSTCTVRAWHANHGHAQLALPTVLSRDSLIRDLTLMGERMLIGHVTGPDGAPVPGARLNLLAEAPDSRPYLAGTSDSDGRFALPVLKPDPTRRQLWAWAPQVGGALVELPPGPGPADVGEVRLVPVAPIRGQVLLADNTPAPHVLVSARICEAALLGNDVPGGPCGYSDFEATVITDERGAFAVQVPPQSQVALSADGTHVVEAIAPQSDVILRIEHVLVHVSINDDSGERLNNVGLVVSRFSSEETALFDALRALRVDLWSAAPGKLRTDVWSSGGTFFLSEAPGTRLWLLAETEGCLPAAQGLVVPSDAARVDVTLTLRAPQATGRVRLTCVLPDGRTAPAARVHLRSPSGGTLFQGVVELPDGLPPLAAGEWILEATPTTPGEAPRRVEPEAWALVAQRRVTVPADGVADLHLAHEAGGRLRLTLRPPAGETPPAGPDDAGFWSGPRARVLAIPSGEATALEFVHSEHEDGRARGWGSVVPLGRSARAATLLAPGPYRLEVAARGSGWKDLLVAAEVTIHPGRFSDLELDLPAAK